MKKASETINRLSAKLHYEYYRYIKSKNYRKRKIYAKDPDFIIEEFINQINVPKDKILFLHVGLKEIKQITGLSYSELTKSIVSTLNSNFSPKAIVAPTFTWGFITTGVFSVNFSKSETGIFSELFRKHHGNYRTPNAIQSFSILSEDSNVFKGLRHEDTFGRNGIYNFFKNNETWIIDLNTDTFRASPLHHIELSANVPYIDKPYIEFEGILFDKNNNPQHHLQRHGGTYIYDGKYTWNKEKIKTKLSKCGVLKESTYRGIKLSYLNNNDLYEVMINMINNNPYYLITL